MNYEKLKPSIQKLKALKCPISMHILCLLQNEPMTGTDILFELRKIQRKKGLQIKLHQSDVSRRLTKLKNAGVVTTQKRGKYNYFHFQEYAYDDILDKVREFNSSAALERQGI